MEGKTILWSNKRVKFVGEFLHHHALEETHWVINILALIELWTKIVIPNFWQEK